LDASTETATGRGAATAAGADCPCDGADISNALMATDKPLKYLMTLSP
jgi:hypothetical protein